MSSEGKSAPEPGVPPAAPELEAALLASEGVYRELLERQGEGFSVLDAQERFLLVNPVAEAIFGVAPGSLLGRSLMEFLSPDQQDVVHRESRLRAQGTPSTYELQIRRGDGAPRTLLVTATPRPGRAGKALQVIEVYCDITERKRAEDDLRWSEANMQAILASAADGLLAIGMQRQVLHTNGRFAEIWRVPQVLIESGDDKALLEYVLTMLVDPAGFLAKVEALYGSDQEDMDLVRFIDGRIIERYSRPMLLDGVVTGRVWSFRDITERTRAEEENLKLLAQLYQSQKMEGLGILTGGVAHDMNNVLGAILVLASTHLELQPPGSAARRAFDTIVKAATRGGDMVKRLLTFARQSQAEECALDVNALLREETHLLERTTLAKVRLELDLAPDLPPILGDASALTHAFMNLCLNAVDAMPEQGLLVLRTRRVDGNWIEVVVEDTGTGMPPAVLERALEPFFTTKEVGKGTGLGLSMVYRTVQAHQGRMEIHSQPGQGTQVRLRFPICEPAAQAAVPAAEPRAQVATRTLSVLLVDDDELFRSATETLLRALGHAVISSSSGEEALATIEAGLAPDVVLLDMNMPGLGGSGTLPRLRALLPVVPVLISTGRSDQVALDLVKAHPHVSLLPKPFTLHELEQHLAPLGQA